MFACVAVATQAQEVADAKYSVSTNSFWSNWFVSVNGTYNMFYSNEEKGMSDRPGLFDGSRSTAGLNLSIGKWFTPGLGLRTRLSGFWGRHVTPDAVGSLKNTSHNSIKYWDVQEQVLFNLHNLLLGYNEERVWNAIPYFGFGITRLMSENDYAHGYSVGLLNTFKINSRMAVNLDLGYNFSDDDFSGAARSSHKNYGTSFPLTDRHFSVALGLTFNLGKSGWTKAGYSEALYLQYQQEIDELNGRIRDAENDKNRALADKDAKIAELQRALADCQSKAGNGNQPVSTNSGQKAPVVLQPIVLFSQGSSVVETSQYPALELIANYMKNHPEAIVLIKGYASPEGSNQINQQLSKDRAAAVNKLLVEKYNISANRLKAEGFGPTDKLFEEPAFNRVVIFSEYPE